MGYSSSVVGGAMIPCPASALACVGLGCGRKMREEARATELASCSGRFVRPFVGVATHKRTRGRRPRRQPYTLSHSEDSSAKCTKGQTHTSFRSCVPESIAQRPRELPNERYGGTNAPRGHSSYTIVAKRGVARRQEERRGSGRHLPPAFVWPDVIILYLGGVCARARGRRGEASTAFCPFGLG